MKCTLIENTDQAISAMLQRTHAVSTESLPQQECRGRVLAGSIFADRHLPSWPTSMLDGYAVEANRVAPGIVKIHGTTTPGMAPVQLPAGETRQIFTGGILPAGADAVIARELVEEHAEHITLGSLQVHPGQGVRGVGESAAAGDLVLLGGQVLGPAQLAAAAACGGAKLSVYRPVRVTAIITGNELVESSSVLPPWKVRDTSGPALAALFGRTPWIHWQGARQVPDDPDGILQAISVALEQCDTLLVTGGVSVGDYDYVPRALADAGAETVFHRLPIRPGKPLLGAIGPRGQAIWGLPGNPLSTLVTARRFVVPVLRCQAGYGCELDQPHWMRIAKPDARSITLSWSRLVRSISSEEVELVRERYSADLAAAARSEGFVELPPGAAGEGPWPYYSWNFL